MLTIGDMELFHIIRNWFANLFRPKALHGELDEEMEHHLSMTIDKKVAEGMSPNLAKKAALKEFGSVERLRDECQDAWGTRFLLDTVSDIRFAARQLIKSKGYLAVTILTIAMCSGLNVSIYRYVHAWIVKPFDYPNAEEVVAVGKIWKKQRNKVGAISPLSFTEIEREARSFKAIGLVDSDDNVDVVVPNGSAFVADVMLITPGIWDVAGVKPLLSSTFTRGSVEEGHDKVAVIGYQIWQSRFGGSVDVIGKQIRLDDSEHTIIGVMPDRFNILYPNRTMWLPRKESSHEMKEANRESNSHRVIARLNEGVGISQAQVELDHSPLCLRGAAFLWESG